MPKATLDFDVRQAEVEQSGCSPQLARHTAGCKVCYGAFVTGELWLCHEGSRIYTLDKWSVAGGGLPPTAENVESRLLNYRRKDKEK
jgi:hypothetical protein